MIQERKCALITGASSGIGAEFVRHLARSGGWHLIITARRGAMLEELKRALERECDVEITPIAGDLTSVDFRNSLCEQISATCSALELLVNNAGFGLVGSFATQDSSKLCSMVELNCIAPLHLTKLLLPLLERNRRSPGIINVASIAGFQPLPQMSVYSATKAFLLTLGVALREELRGTKLKLLTLCPGPTATEFHLAAGVVRRRDVLPSMGVERVVAEALKAFDSDRAIWVNGWLNWCFTVIFRLLGNVLAAQVAKPILKRYRSEG